jgi:plastocyanin
MPQRAALFFALSLLTLPLAARAATFQVDVGGGPLAFSPSTLTIQVGDTVTWTNRGGFHDVVSDGNFSSGTPSSSAWTFSHTFNTAGTYDYYCTPHQTQGMTGKVIVQGGGNRPAAPNHLHAMVLSGTEVMLHWTDNSSDETGFRIERRLLDGEFAEVATAPAGSAEAVVPGHQPGEFYLYRMRAERNGTFSRYSETVFAATPAAPAPCVQGPNTLCLNNGRFKVEVDWRTTTEDGQAAAVPIPSAPDSGLFYFFNSANMEMLIKVLDACQNYDHFWVFYAATTNVEFSVLVTDTATGQVRPYYNPQGQAAPPEQDTDAFATCP